MLQWLNLGSVENAKPRYTCKYSKELLGAIVYCTVGIPTRLLFKLSLHNTRPKDKATATLHLPIIWVLASSASTRELDFR